MPMPLHIWWQVCSFHNSKEDEMKATQVATVLYEPKEYKVCIVCHQPTFAPYAKVEDGKWICRRSCYETYEKEKEDGNEEMSKV